MSHRHTWSTNTHITPFSAPFSRLLLHQCALLLTVLFSSGLCLFQNSVSRHVRLRLSLSLDLCVCLCLRGAEATEWCSRRRKHRMNLAATVNHHQSHLSSTRMDDKWSGKTVFCWLRVLLWLTMVVGLAQMHSFFWYYPVGFHFPNY